MEIYTLDDMRQLQGDVHSVLVYASSVVSVDFQAVRSESYNNFVAGGGATQVVVLNEDSQYGDFKNGNGLVVGVIPNRFQSTVFKGSWLKISSQYQFYEQTYDKFLSVRSDYLSILVGENLSVGIQDVWMAYTRTTVTVGKGMSDFPDGRVVILRDHSSP